jgi:hypothetical protein
MMCPAERVCRIKRSFTVKNFRLHPEANNAIRLFRAEVVELVDTQDSGSCARKGVLVRFQSSAPLNNPKQFIEV